MKLSLQKFFRYGRAASRRFVSGKSLFIVLFLLSGVFRPAHAQTPSAVAAVVNARDLPNFGVVAPGIYRGAAPTAEGLRRLKEAGVHTIIDLRIERKGQKEEAATASALNLRRIRIPMGREAPTKKQIAQFLAALDAAPGEPVFVHCQYGADRTSAMVGLYRERRQHWTFDQTYREMRHYGFNPKLWELKEAVSRSQVAGRSEGI